MKKAAKKGDADYYVAISIIYSNKLDLGGAMIKAKQIKPTVDITMNIADAQGTKVYSKVKGGAKVEKAIKAKDLTGISRVDFTEDNSAEILTAPLLELGQKAVFNLADSFQTLTSK